VEHDEKDLETGERIPIPILKEENFGEDMCIDDKNLGGEGYTILSNAKTGKIALMAMTTKLHGLKKALEKIPGKIRRGVKTISKDLASNYDWLARQYFSFATRVADKFHIIKMGMEALQDVRVRFRQEILTIERQSSENRKTLKETKFENGDTLKELLARSRGLLFKFPGDWTKTQEERAKILFREYPEIHSAYQLIVEFRNFYKSKDTDTALKKLNEWRIRVGESAIPEILNFEHQVNRHQGDILAYFDTRKTNAPAEGLNSHLQRFFVSNYGIRNRDFFHFRIKQLFS
jgi:transposase